MATSEFNIGDKVTFRPYEKAIPAKVVEIVPTNKITFVKDDNRIFYKLTGVDNKHALTTTTTGRSIMESELYNPIEKKPIKSLTCNCCGGLARGRQWYNRDTGYGTCQSCIERIEASNQMSPKEIESCYGIKGVHHSIEGQKED